MGSGVTLVSGKPITQDGLRMAMRVLGLNPEHVKGFEVNWSNLEASYGEGVYSSHKVVESDPWAVHDDDGSVLVADLSGLSQERRKDLRALLHWFETTYSRTNDEAPF